MFKCTSATYQYQISCSGTREGLPVPLFVAKRLINELKLSNDYLDYSETSN